MSRPASMLKTMTACFVALTLCTGFAGCSSAANNQQETAMTTANIEVEESAAKDIEECRTLEGLAKDEVHQQQMAKEDQNPLFGWYQHAYAYQGEEEILPYRLYVPEQSSQKMPLMVVCHGSDGLGSNNSSHVNQLSTSWISDAVQSKDPMYVIAIQMPEDTNPLADLEHCSRDKSTAVL